MSQAEHEGPSPPGTSALVEMLHCFKLKLKYHVAQKLLPPIRSRDYRPPSDPQVPALEGWRKDFWNAALALKAGNRIRFRS